jgi:hypothetical protein
MKKTYYILVILHVVGMGILIPFHELKAQENNIDSPLSVK